MNNQGNDSVERTTAIRRAELAAAREELADLRRRSAAREAARGEVARSNPPNRHQPPAAAETARGVSSRNYQNADITR